VSRFLVVDIVQIMCLGGMMPFPFWFEGFEVDAIKSV
jgi:hypothetical protein